MSTRVMRSVLFPVMLAALTAAPVLAGAASDIGRMSEEFLAQTVNGLLTR